MGCSSSKSQAKAVPPSAKEPDGSKTESPNKDPDSGPDAAGELDAPTHTVSTVLPEDLRSAPPPAVDVPAGTVCFSQQSHAGVDLSVAGEARSRVALCWSGSCWSEEEVSASSQYRGVSFTCSMNYVMPGLKAASSNKKDSYAELDYGMYCSPVGRLQLYERGYLVFTDSGKYTDSSTLELRIANDGVKYIVDGREVYTSKMQPERALHFAIAWHDHPASVTKIKYV